MSRLSRLPSPRCAPIVALFALVTFGVQGCHVGCDAEQSVACLCTDGTCQAGIGGCVTNTVAPTCSDLCQSHRGPELDAGYISVCPGDAGPADAGVSNDAGLHGPNAFPIAGAWMSPHETTAACGLASTILADGGIAAVGIQLYSNLGTAGLCALNAGQDAGPLTGLALNIGLGTPEFVAANLSHDAGPLTQVLTPGVYTLFNEDVSDQTLCERVPGYDAVLTEFEFESGNATPLFNGVGTITIDQFGGGTLTATLNAWLVSVDGTPGVDGGPLTGTFSASFCP